MKISLFIFAYIFLVACPYTYAKNNIPTINSFNQNELQKHVKFLSELKPARNYKNIQSLNAAAEYIENEFMKYGYSPRLQKYEVKGRQYKNIIAAYGKLNAPVLVIGAHYDVAGDQPGADDNASGVASLLALAQEISQKKPTLPFRIEFVAFTLEEPPFFRSKKMGSYMHAKNLKDTNVNVIGMVSLEMLGYFSSKKDSQDYPIFFMKFFYPSTGDFIAVVSNSENKDFANHFYNQMGKASVKVEKLTAPSIFPGVDFSDHLNYWRFGYKALMITDTSFYRNKNYHDIYDTMDTLDFVKMAEVTYGIYSAIINLKK